MQSLFYFLKKYNLVGKFVYKKIYSNEFIPQEPLKKILQDKNKKLKICRPILAYGCKLIKKNLNLINEKKNKLTATNFLKKGKLKKKIIFHNFYLEKIKKHGKKFKLICRNNKKKRIFIVNKVILAAGTIATTKIIIDYLNIKKR